MNRTVLVICLFVLLNIDACEPLTLRSMRSPVTPVLGNNSLTLTCSYTKSINDIITTFTLKRRLPGQTTFDILVTYIPDAEAVTYGNVSNIESRTTAGFTDVGDPFLQFSSILCDDKADYMWECRFLEVDSEVVLRSQVRYTTLSVKVKAPTTFRTDSEQIIISPSPPVLEGDRVTFTCKGDVGDEPAGHFGWFYYLNDATSGGIDISNQAVPIAPQDNPNRACSKQRMSVLQMNMTRSLNRMIVRCTVQQDKKDEFGEGYRQTYRVTVLSTPTPTSTSSVDPPSTTSVPAQTAQTCGYSLEVVIGALCGGFIAGIVLSAVIGVSEYRRLRHYDVQKQTFFQLGTRAASTERSMEPIQEPASRVPDVGFDNYETLTDDRPHHNHGYSTLKF